MLDFANELTTGDEKSVQLVQNLKDRLLQHVEEEQLVVVLLQNSKVALTAQLQSTSTPLMQFLVTNLNKIITDIEQDKTNQEKINRWIDIWIER